MILLQSSFHRRAFSGLAALACMWACGTCAVAGLTVNQLDDAPAWPGSPIISTTGGGNLQTDYNVEVTLLPTECANTTACPGAATHTFVPTTSFQLDKFSIRLAGAPTTGEIFLYPEPVGGADTDGFVNVSFSTSLLNGGAGLPFTFFGSPTRNLMEFDLTDSDEITLAAGTKYAIDIRNTGSDNMYWLRASNAALLNTYTSGNIYETTDNTQPGERFAVANGPRDGTLALYAVSAPVLGDFNNNGSVDAADYVLWRNGGPLANEVTDPGTVSPADYNDWKARFGRTSGSGAGLQSAGVPEPTCAVLLLVMGGILGFRRKQR